jgi:hypothetical protein
VAGGRARAGVVAKMLARIRRSFLPLLSAGLPILGLLYMLVASSSISQMSSDRSGWVVPYSIVLFYQYTAFWLGLLNAGLLVFLVVQIFRQDAADAENAIKPVEPLGKSCLAIAAIFSTLVGCLFFAYANFSIWFERLEHKAAVSLNQRSYNLALLNTPEFECDVQFVVLACNEGSIMCRAEWLSVRYNKCGFPPYEPLPTDTALISDEAANSLYVQLDGERIEVPVGE